MKTKMTKLLSILVLFSLLLPMVLHGEEEKKPLFLSSEDQFLQFAENCRIDSYSEGRTVTLRRDLDLTGRDFAGIPLFLGTFDGNHHKITGLSLTADGSNLGLFRFIGEGARVKRLTVEGTIAPEGSRLNIGGIAGTNRGTIENCRFDGSVSGIDRIGSLAGVNDLTGVIENCQSMGSVTGDHFLGGMAGENSGVIRDCVNRSEINTVARESTVNVESISIETITGTESPSTITDLGGIAGTSTGVIRDCINRGPVGYPHMGYNVGGIAGSQNGTLLHCQNYGKVFGRKEVGGIAGQFEPVSKIEFQIDTLQILEKQLESTSSLLNRASYNAQNNMGAVGQHISNMMDDSEAARDAISHLKPEDLKDKDTLIAAHNKVKSSIQSMYQSMGNLGRTAGAAAGQMSHDLKAVSSQISAMSRTIKEANEYMGITLSDVSDQDTEEDLSGKIADCANFEEVSGDLNAGGIAGSIAFENDLDPEEDLSFSGDRSLNFEGSLRAVILNCENRGIVTARKLQAGGIVGFQSMGLVKNSVNTGPVQAEKVQYVGGIAGSSRGYIRSCYVKCELSGLSCVGGIAGSGTVATDCRSMVNIRTGSEKLGAILGIQELPQNEEIPEPVKNNLYMSLSQDPGAIDGISYEGMAEPLPPYKFRELPDLPDTFRLVKFRFEGEDGSREHYLTLPIGTVFHPEDVPEVPEKKGFHGQWQDLSDYVSRRAYFDQVFTPIYTPYRMTISSPQTRENGRPVLLAEGTFPNVDHIDLKQIQNPVIGKKTVLETWEIPRLSKDHSTVFHFHAPEEQDLNLLRISVRKKDGSWEETSAAVSGRHLIFSLNPTDTAFCVTEEKDLRGIFYAGCAITAAAALLILHGVLKKRSKKAAAKS